VDEMRHVRKQEMQEERKVEDSMQDQFSFKMHQVEIIESLSSSSGNTNNVGDEATSYEHLKVGEKSEGQERRVSANIPKSQARSQNYAQKNQKSYESNPGGEKKMTSGYSNSTGNYPLQTNTNSSQYQEQISDDQRIFSNQNNLNDDGPNGSVDSEANENIHISDTIHDQLDNEDD
jgi:hypothetical protein